MMPNVGEGLEVGGEQGLDPNNPRDFETILEGKGVPKEEGDTDSPSTDIRSGLTTEEPAQGRDPGSGRFVAKEAAQQTPPPDTSEAVTDTSEEDPEVAAFLAKYGGDPAAALKAAASAQSLIGRQGEELGKTREELSELRGLVEGLKQVASLGATNPLPVLTADQVEEAAQSLIDSHGNYFDAATKAINSSDERVYDSILEQWALEQPIQAQRYDLDFQMWKRERNSQAAAPEAPERPAWMADAETQHKVSTIEQSLKAVAAEHTPESWATVSAQFETAMEQMPQNVLEMVGSPDAEARDAGVRIVVDRATLLATRAPATSVTPQEQQVPASVARKLAGSQVASSALKAPAKSEGTQTREEAIAEFKRQIVEQETTNVQSGLTYGPQP